VDTSVDEADVGNVREGETAHISVTAFPNVTFAGTVQQVRVNPTVVQNVVTYDAVVIVHDTSGRLLPGMTAQVTIDVGKRTHALTLPIAALLYRPLATGGASSAAQGNGSTSAPVAGAPGSQVTVWVLGNGRPQAVPVVIGLSDGQNVEIASGDLHAGDRVVIAQVRGQGRGPGAQGPGGGVGPVVVPGPGGGR
jgi:HlyD family secretion protein